MTLKDSGARSEFSTGAVRDAQGGKGRYDLMPVRALRELAKLYEAGANKYAARNWEKGIPLSRFLDSGDRHKSNVLMNMHDEPHLVQYAWNVVCWLDTVLRIKEGLLPAELNDLPGVTIGANCTVSEQPKTIDAENKLKKIKDLYGQLGMTDSMRTNKIWDIMHE